MSSRREPCNDWLDSLTQTWPKIQPRLDSFFFWLCFSGRERVRPIFCQDMSKFPENDMLLASAPTYPAGGGAPYSDAAYNYPPASQAFSPDYTGEKGYATSQAYPPVQSYPPVQGPSSFAHTAMPTYQRADPVVQPLFAIIESQQHGCSAGHHEMVERTVCPPSPCSLCFSPCLMFNFLIFLNRFVLGVVVCHILFLFIFNDCS